MAQLPAGTWRTHLAYSSVTQVAETSTKVFGLSDGALFAYNKTTQDINIYSKVDGLSDSKVALISYSSDNNVLVIVYDNANIDLLTNDGHIYNISNIKDNPLPLNKTINKVNFSGNKAYLATAYGVSVINLTKHEVSETYLLNKSVLSTALFNGYIFAATKQGLLAAPLTSSLIDPNNWTLTNTLSTSDLAVFQNSLVGVVTNIGLYSFTSNTNQLIKSNTIFTNLFVANNVLVAYGLTQLSYFTSLNQETVVTGTNFNGLSSLDPTTTTWHAASTSGLNQIIKSGQNYAKVTLGLKPQGPFANSPYKMHFSGEKLMVVGGGAYYDRNSTLGMMMFFENEQWSYFRLDTIKAQGSTVRDLNDIVQDPREAGHYFVTSYGEGVYEFRNKKLVKIHDHTNSGIETVNLSFLKGINHFDRTYGLCYDKDNNLFVTNCFTNNIVKILSKDGVWSSLNYTQIANNEAIFDIIQTKNGIFWALSPWKNPGVFAFNPKSTLTDQSDDQTSFISSISYLDNGAQKTIVPSSFNCFTEDKNSALWIGTDKGPIIFNNTAQAFDANFMGTRIKLAATASSPIAGFLLENDNVNAIAVDAANRKWIGTDTNGVYLVSDNGEQTIFHFSEENSPLVSNKILSLAIHPTTGEVFIGTDKGLVSYRNDALINQKSFTEVYASPNPVRPEYEGSITISGLKTETAVKITDTKGNIVFEGTSTESQITWNGRNTVGDRVATGIYLVYASTSDTLESLVTKIMVVK